MTDGADVNEDHIQRARRRFERMAARGFDPAEPHEWQFTITASDPADLKRFASRLEERGFVVREPMRVPDGSTWLMNIGREEVHTPESLHALSDELVELAAAHGVFCGGGSSVGWEQESDDD